MSKEIYISSTPHETRLAIVENELSEIYYERENEYTLAGSIYNGRVTRVLPGMQSAFVDVGLERDAFLYITDFMEEQGESADFDSGETRSPRREGGSREGREGRGERGGRERRRDRGERRSESPDGEQPAEPRTFEDEYAFGAEPLREAEGEDAEASTADGSRRWRGRRGRRRGRGSNGESRTEDQQQPQQPSVVLESEGFDDEPTQEPREAEPRHEREERREGRRSERREGRGRRDRDDRRHAEIRERFAPRGLRSGHREGEEAVDLSASAASAEPFILPGESLSKYRRGEEAQTETAAETKAAAAPVTHVARPSTEIDLSAAGWDGGFVLPGETLSRRRTEQPREESREAAAPAESAGEPRGDRSGRNRRRERDERRGRREARLSPAEAVLPAVTSQHEPEPSVLPFSDNAPEFAVAETEVRLELEHDLQLDPAYEPQTDVAPISPEAAEATVDEAVEEFHETIAEYEPEEEASASFRVDVAAPSEFRQAAPVEEDEFIAAEEGIGHTEAADGHEFTSIQATGEMISDLPEQAEETHDLTAPMDHERAVQGVHLAESEGTPLPPHIFAPGEGQLEEELLDDEDETIILAATFDDDMEEETLEGAADLGSMIEDLSLDALVRPEAELLDEEEEEDDLEFDDEEMDEEELAAESEIAGSDVSEAEEDEFAVSSSFEDLEEPEEEEAPAAEGEPSEQPGERRERSGRRDRGRRGGRDRDRERGSRDRRGMANSRSGGRISRQSAQMTDLPAISDLLKPGQEVLVQIAKEPIAKKGARITSHIALPGRFLVFMPTVNHVGVSRKIDSDGERRRLKEILLSEKGDASGGFIVRTAAAGASEDELRSDLRFLLNLWADIKQRSEASKSPALIYHDLNLVERILRDQVTDNFSAIWVDTEDAYERVLRFLQRFQPSLIRRVKLYTKEMPLFEQFGIQEEINKALRSKVWLKSGGSIVINQTEALVAIDINTGKYVGKTARLEDTIVKTNLDAIPEIVRQIRLRDLGGIIVIDFIDMDERKNRQKVLQALEEELKKDRAPSKVLQFNDFGLVAITRKRVKQSLERTLSTTCNICTGTGMVKSPITVCNEIYTELRKMHKHIDKGDIMLRVNPEVVKQLKSNSGKWLQEMEEMSGKTILVKSDPGLHPEQFDLH